MEKHRKHISTEYTVQPSLASRYNTIPTTDTTNTTTMWSTCPVHDRKANACAIGQSVMWYPAVFKNLRTWELVNKLWLD